MAGTTLNVFGLIGYPLSHSFSKKYFSQKFEKEGITDATYELFSLGQIEELPPLIARYANLKGLNVTIPYKQAVFPFLNEIDAEAEAVGAVNTIKIRDGRLTGYNSDVYGFEKSLLELLQERQANPKELRALVLGTGGAAKAVVFVLKKLGIAYWLVSRNRQRGDLAYEDVSAEILNDHHLLINTTPLGMAPNLDTCPALPYEALTAQHLLYDLVYNPEETRFLRKGKQQNAATRNGLQMLYLQAERSWEIWNQ